MSARDRDPELAKERAVKSELQRIMTMTVSELVEDIGTVRARVIDIACEDNLSSYVGLAIVNIDLQSLIEAVAQAEVDK